MKFLAVVGFLTGLAAFVWSGYLLLMADSAVHQLVLYCIVVLPSFLLMSLCCVWGLRKG